MPFAFFIFTLSYVVRRQIAKGAAVLGLTLFSAVAVAPAMAEPVTVAALGDSLTAGYGLREAEGLVPQLQAWLDAKAADAVVLNAGVSGDTTAGGLARLDWTLTPEVDALIVTLGGNDMLRGLDPAVSKANLDAILASATAKGLPVLLVGLTSTNNYGPEFKEKFDAMFPELAEKYQVPLLPSFFRPLLIDPAGMPAFMQGDGIHPNPTGVKMIVDQLGPMVMDLVNSARD